MELISAKTNEQVKQRLKKYFLENRNVLDELIKDKQKKEFETKVVPNSTATKSSVGNKTSKTKTIDFSVIFFSDASNSNAGNRYDFVINMAKYADQHGYKAIWLPERHFHSFGGNFSSPSVLCGMLSGITDTIRLRAGSIVLPLEHPARVVEEWSVLDNLSGGRVDLGMASGWNPNDFVLSPDTYPDLRNVWKKRIPIVQDLWEGKAASFINGKGEDVAIEIYPKPVQKKLNIWLTATENEETFIEAGAKGYNILTMLKGISLAELKPKIKLYRKAREENGFDPDSGVVTLMLHTFVNPDEEYVRRHVESPFKKYIESAISGHVQILDKENRPSKSEVDALVDYAYERYYKTAALFGTPEHCKSVVEDAIEIGVNEIACLQDFGVDSALVLDSLSHLTDLKNKFCSDNPTIPERKETRKQGQVNAKALDINEAVAIVGLSCQFPGSRNKTEYWENLLNGKELLSDIPEQRWAWQDHFGDPSLEENKCKVKKAGFIDDAILDAFSPDLFGLNPREASVIDPHQKLFLQVAWSCLEDAGYAGRMDEISNTGVFAAMYNLDHAGKKLDLTQPVSPYDIAGVAHSIVANRTSYAFNFTGPSEVVDTACSSSLVALHRAINAIRSGECDSALVGGVSLLLGPHRVIALSKLGLLSQESHCKPFDNNTTGQVIGEGAGVLMLKPLSKAQKDGDHIYGLIKGSSVNHNGNNSGSLTLPDANSQAKLVLNACDNANVDFDTVSYIEAHGAGGYGDIIELEAFKKATKISNVEATSGHCLVGSVKPNIGFLEASGGISQLIKVLLMLESKKIAPTINNHNVPEEVELDKTRYRIAKNAVNWDNDNNSLPRRAGVHAYGLGGTNAHIILEEYTGQDQKKVKLVQKSDYPFLFSGATREHLHTSLSMMIEFFSTLVNRDENTEHWVPAVDVSYTLATGRKHFNERTVFVAKDLKQLVSQMKNYLDVKKTNAKVSCTITESDGENSICSAYVLSSWQSGEGVNWVEAYDGIGAKKVSLPTSVFVTEAKDKRVDVASKRAVLTSEGCWKVSFSKNDSCISDHKVEGERIVPAVIYLDVMAQIVGSTTDFPLQLQDVSWQLPCVVEVDEKSLGVRLCVEGRKLVVYSNFHGIDIEYCTAEITPSSADGVKPALQAPSDDVSDYVLLGAEDCYQRYLDRGVELGDTYKGIDRCYIKGREILTDITGISAPIECKSNVINPTVLDALFQSCGILLDETVDDTRSRFLPFSLSTISIFAPLNAQTYRGRVTLVREHSQQGMYWFDMALFSEEECVVKVKSFCLKRLPTESTEHKIETIPNPIQEKPLRPSSNSCQDKQLLKEFCEVLAKYNTRKWIFGIRIKGNNELHGKIVLDGSRVDFSTQSIHEELEIQMFREDLSQLVAGTMDPTVLYLTGRFNVYPENALSLQRSIGEMLFRHHNEVNLHDRLRQHLIGDIYRTGQVESSNGEVRYIFPWSIPSSVGTYIYQFVSDNNLTRTLEIGMAYGLASLCLCKAHDERGDGSHIAVDPCQTSDFLNIARRNLMLAKLDHYSECVEKPDFLALPQLYSENKRFDFVFIDGLHMFDYTLIDFFYSDLLLDIGGFVAFDDSQVPGVTRVLDFIKTNRNYELMPTPVERLTLFRKKSDDSRSLLNPNHYEEF